MPALPKDTILLAIDPTSRGFAFAVLEVPAFLLDWGSKTAAKSGDLLRKVDALLSRYKPDMLVLEDLAAKGARRRVRARKEIQAMERLAFTRGVRVEWVSRLGVLDTFAPGETKYEVAARLAEIFPVLADRLPRKRKTWTSEEARMNVFDALGFAGDLEGYPLPGAGSEPCLLRPPALGRGCPFLGPRGLPLCLRGPASTPGAGRPRCRLMRTARSRPPPCHLTPRSDLGVFLCDGDSQSLRGCGLTP